MTPALTAFGRYHSALLATFWAIEALLAALQCCSASSTLAHAWVADDRNKTYCICEEEGRGNWKNTHGIP
jgi:hypothetical protein